MRYHETPTEGHDMKQRIVLSMLAAVLLVGAVTAYAGCPPLTVCTDTITGRPTPTQSNPVTGR